MKTRSRTLTTALIPAAAGLQVDQIAVGSGQITVALTSTRPRAACPDTVAAHQLAHDFLRLVRERGRDGLDPWLTEAEGGAVPELRRFAAGLRRDQAAVEAALTYAWSSGQTEGQVTRLKLIKRAMYGRAGFDLLRRRVLQAA